MEPLVSLCMIVRNEAGNLRACLEPVADLVDEIIVVDTGSTDATKAIAAELGAKVYDFAWIDDFSAARNETLRHATGRWIFWLDADDRIDPPNRRKLAALFAELRQDPQNNAAYLMPCLSRIGAPGDPAYTATHTRLFPHRPDLMWHGRIHEHPDTNGRTAEIQMRWSDVLVQHVGYLDPIQGHRKRSRNLRLLQIEYATNPENSSTLFYLGWTQLDCGRLEEGLHLLRRSIQRAPDINCPWVRKAYALLAQCLAELGRSEESLRCFDAGLARYPNDPELLYRRASLLHKLGDAPAAEACLLRLINAPAETYLQYSVESGLRGPKARHLLALIYKQCGRLAEAEAQCRLALAEQPTNSEAWATLGQIYVSQRRLGEAEVVIQRLANCPLGQALAPTLRAQLLATVGRFDEAVALLEHVIATNQECSWARLTLGHLLFSRGVKPERCIEIYQGLLAQNPHDQAAQRRLEQLQSRVTRQPAAQPHPAAPAPGQGTFVFANAR